MNDNTLWVERKNDQDNNGGVSAKTRYVQMMSTDSETSEICSTEDKNPMVFRETTV